MIIIGLTGGIASGKSTVAGRLRQKGAVIIDADRLAREVVEPGQPALKEIASQFGREILFKDGRLNRKVLAAVVFNNPAARTRLNEITHPKIHARTRELLLEVQKHDEHAVVVIDAPLLLETGMHKMVDEVWLTAVDDQIQLERIMNRDKLTLEQARQRANAQMSLEEKKKNADRIIETGGTLVETFRQVDELWDLLTAKKVNGKFD